MYPEKNNFFSDVSVLIAWLKVALVLDTIFSIRIAIINAFLSSLKIFKIYFKFAMCWKNKTIVSKRFYTGEQFTTKCKRRKKPTETSFIASSLDRIQQKADIWWYEVFQVSITSPSKETTEAVRRRRDYIL